MITWTRLDRGIYQSEDKRFGITYGRGRSHTLVIDGERSVEGFTSIAAAKEYAEQVGPKQDPNDITTWTLDDLLDELVVAAQATRDSDMAQRIDARRQIRVLRTEITSRVG